jgi:hypothetical protein
MTGKGIGEFLDRESRKHFEEIFPSILEKDDFICEVVFIRKDGKPIDIECNPRVIIDENNEITSIVLLQKFMKR